MKVAEIQACSPVEPSSFLAFAGLDGAAVDEVRPERDGDDEEDLELPFLFLSSLLSFLSVSISCKGGGRYHSREKEPVWTTYVTLTRQTRTAKFRMEPSLNSCWITSPKISCDVNCTLRRVEWTRQTSEACGKLQSSSKNCSDRLYNQGRRYHNGRSTFSR